MFSKAEIAESFMGAGQLRSLPRGCLGIPTSSGIYVVVRPSADEMVFLPQSLGGHFKGQDGTVSLGRLEANQVKGSDVLYIGRAKNLRRRIDQFARYGRGEPIAHRGGRLLWQIADCDALEIAWRMEPDPIAAEAALLDAFCDQFGRLPFANLVRGTRQAVAA